MEPLILRVVSSSTTSEVKFTLKKNKIKTRGQVERPGSLKDRVGELERRPDLVSDSFLVLSSCSS